MAAISVLMPAYNAGKYIREAIDSILAQTITDWELIIVNDGSADDTEAIVLSYGDTRIRYFSNGQNRGLVYTRNRLIELAGSDILAFLDSDDIATPQRLELQLRYLEQHLDLGLLAGSLLGLYPDRVDRKGFVFDIPAVALRAHLLFYNPVSTSAAMFRRSALPELCFRDNYPPVEDYDLWTRMIYERPGAVMPEVVGYYRLHAESISKTLSKASYANRDKVVLNQLDHYFPGKYTDEEASIHLGLADLLTRNSPADVPLLTAWISKLINLNATAGQIDQEVLAQVLYERVLKKFLRLESYDRSVFQTLLRLKRTLKPQLTWELRKKELAILAFSLAGKKFIATD